MTEPTTHKAETYCGPWWDFFYGGILMDLKPALTYNEQINRLIDVHNLTITSKEAAISILKSINYYRLSGYGIGLKKPDNKEAYREGISLEHIYRLYQFDSLLRNKLIHLIEQLEIQLRTQVAYYLALTYGAEGYMDASNFLDKKNKYNQSIHEIIIENFQKECIRQKNIPFVKHHTLQYDGHFPIWVAIELFTFGNLSSLYSILNLEDKKQIASLYHTKPQYLSSWLLSLVEIRNICAHYSRLYNMPLKQTPRLYSDLARYVPKKSNKLFPVLIAIKRMLESNYQWQEFEQELEQLMETYDDVIYLSFIGFPENWKSALA